MATVSFVLCGSSARLSARGREMRLEVESLASLWREGALWSLPRLSAALEQLGLTLRVCWRGREVLMLGVGAPRWWTHLSLNTRPGA